MKKLILLLLAGILFVPVFAQKNMAPSKVSKAAFFDKTIPLRDMKKIAPTPKDNSWEDGEVKNESLKTDYKDGDKWKTDLPSIQSVQGGTQVNGPIVNIGGTGNVNGVYPPDTDGDVGPDHYFQMMNLSFAIYDKVGNKLYGPVANSTLWQGFPGPWSGHNDGDPIVLYDEIADRWMASQFAVQASNGKHYELIAISETGDPLGSWYRYAFEFDYFCDYPKLGVWPDGYYATFHMFQGSFKGTAFVAFEREKMLVGDPDAQMVYYGEFSSKFGFLPSDVDGEAPPMGTPNYITGISFFGSHNMQIYEMAVDWDNTANSTLSLAANLSPATFNSDVNGIPQPGTGNKLDVMNMVLMFRLPFRKFDGYNVLLANHTVKVGGKAAIRWYELRDDGSGWEIYQQGTYAPDNENRWMGSIAMTANGNIGLAYSVGSSSTHPSLRYTGRTSDAPLGEMNIAEVEIIAGESSQTGISRWGDYSCLTPDVSNDSVFWFTSEYMKSNGWGTRISSFDFGPTQAATAYAGEDDSVCEDSFFFTAGSALYYSSLEWTTSGDGQFQNPNTLGAKYLRGPQDVENGSVVLTLTSYGYESGQQASDDMTLTIIREAVADAGEDMTVNSTGPVMLNGQADFYTSVMWTTSGDGTFDDPALLDASYTMGSNDIANGEVSLTLTATGDEMCGFEDSDNMTLFYDPTTGIQDATAEELSISIIPNPSSGKFRLEIKGNKVDDVDISIINMQGKTVYSKKTENIKGEFSGYVDISEEGKGVYILKVNAGSVQKISKIVLN